MTKDKIPECRWRYEFWANNKSRFPILSKIGSIVSFNIFYNLKSHYKLFRGAKDSTSVLERTFATASRFLSNQRNALLAATVESYIKFGTAEDFSRYLESL